MERYEYATMAAFEDFYWWYRGLHPILADVLSTAGIGAQSAILDAGCGTGGNLRSMRRILGGEQFGFDLSPEARRFWQERHLHRCAVASINDMPYAANTFDAVVSVDVLENEFVDQDKAMTELARVTRPGGVLLLLMPAYRWLLSEEHHRAVHTTRRYVRPEVVAMMRANGFEVVRATYLFTFLFPVTALYRFALSLKPRAEVPRSELKPLPKPVNEAFAGIMGVERRLLRSIDFPFGSSILVMGKKAAPAS